MARKRILLIMLCVLTIATGVSNGFAMPFFTDASKQAVFLSPLEKWDPTWRLEAYISPLQRAGYQVDVLLNENVSISFLKTGLAKYDLIILRTDSFTLEGFSYYCSGETATFKSRATFAAEISSREVGIAACVGFSMLFLQHYYPAGSLRPALVYVLGGPSAELSSAFLSAGASAFIGYYEAYSIGWGRMDAYSQKLFEYLSQGYSVVDATMQMLAYLKTGHGNTADWPASYWAGDGSFTI